MPGGSAWPGSTTSSRSSPVTASWATSPVTCGRLIEHELGDRLAVPGAAGPQRGPVDRGRGRGRLDLRGAQIRNETRKVLGLPDLRVSATCVRVPVITGHSVAVHATFARQIDVDEARQALVEAPAVVVLDDPEACEFPTPADIVGSDPRSPGGLRQALDFPNTLDFFICGDNLRKGAALNMVQVAELVARDLAVDWPAPLTWTSPGWSDEVEQLVAAVCRAVRRSSARHRGSCSSCRRRSGS